VALPRQVSAAVRVQRGGAVRTHDAQILDAMIIADAIDVVEDQRD